MSRINLFPHNKEALQEINSKIESGITKFVIPHATGSGKTYLMGALAEQYNDDKKLVLEPRIPLRNDIEKKFCEFGIANTDFITYQKLIRKSDKDIADMDYKVVFLDECHHGTTPVWGQKIDCLINTHPKSIIVGTSATIIRNDGVNVAEHLFDNNSTEELSLATAIAKKILPCPHYIGAIYNLDEELERLKKKVENTTNTKEEKSELYAKIKTMQSHFEKSYGIPTILNKYIKVKNGKYLVFCKDQTHLKEMRDVVIGWFRTAGIKNIHSYSVYSEYQDKEKDYNDFCNDNSNALKILFSINMLNEGIHPKNISGVMMLRSTGSYLVYLQQLGRLLSADNLDKYLVVFDFVNNFSSVNDGLGLLKEIKDAIAKENNTNFDDSGFDDIDTFFVLDQIIEIQNVFDEIKNSLSNNWTDNEDNVIINQYPIIGAIGCSLILNRSILACRMRAFILNVKYKNNGDVWKDDEKLNLIKNYKYGISKCQEMFPNKTKAAIQYQAQKLGLTNNRRYTKEEKEYLYQNFVKIGATKCANALNRSVHSVNAIASKMGLYSRRLTESEKLIIFKYYPTMGTKCQKFIPNRTIQSIQSFAKNNNIKFIGKKSKYKYVTYDKRTSTWIVRILINGKQKTFGCYKDEDEAGRIAIEMAKKYGKVV